MALSDRALHVAVDARCLNTEHVRGIGKSLYQLISRTAATGAIHWHLLADRPDRPLCVPPGEHIDVEVFTALGARLHRWEQWALPAAARRLDVDVLHAPGTTMPWWQPVPSVVAIHDIGRWRHDDAGASSTFYQDRLLPAAYQRASAVMTVSNTARRDILARWPALKPKLHVVSPGVDERYLEVVPDGGPIEVAGRVVDEPYLLYIGGSDPRKRLAWALQTWLGGTTRDVTLIACGIESAAHESVRRMVPREFQERLVLAPHVEEAEMPRLFMHAAAVLYPSLGGGFGLPVIEAQAVGTPVLFSDVTRLAELNGPAAVVLPVDDLPAWIRTADVIVRSRHGRGPDRIARAWAGQYSWDSYVKRTLAVYDSVRAQDLGSRHHETHQRATS
jgi:glycosyltransferase involved in cell wall biosynthesis